MMLPVVGVEAPYHQMHTDIRPVFYFTPIANQRRDTPSPHLFTS